MTDEERKAYEREKKRKQRQKAKESGQRSVTITMDAELLEDLEWRYGSLANALQVAANLPKEERQSRRSKKRDDGLIFYENGTVLHDKSLAYIPSSFEYHTMDDEYRTWTSYNFMLTRIRQYYGFTDNDIVGNAIAIMNQSVCNDIYKHVSTRDKGDEIWHNLDKLGKSREDLFPDYCKELEKKRQDQDTKTLHNHFAYEAGFDNYDGFGICAWNGKENE